MIGWADIVGWLLTHGIRILTILVIGVGLYVATHRIIPPIVYRSIPMTRGESADGTKKRRDTLTAVFIGGMRVLILTTVAFMILSELYIDIGPILAGLGIAGIAIGFGAQYMIRDLIAGFFVIMENQYRVGDVAKIAGISGVVLTMLSKS